MTQPSSLVKSNRLSAVFFYNLKRLKGILIFYSVALLLFSPLALLLEWTMRAQERAEEPNRYGDSFTLYYPSEILFHFIVMVMAVGLPLILFYYLNQKRALDVFHALPVSRKNLYWGNYLSGLAVMLAPYLILGGISAGIMSFQDSYGDRSFFRLMLLALVAVCLYSTMTFIIVNCGTIFESIVYFGIVHIGYLLTLWVGAMYLSDTIFGYQEMTMLGGIKTLAALSPLFQGFYYITEGADLRILLLPVVSIVVTVLGSFLYRSRKSESAGQSFAYLPLFYIGSLMLSVSVGMGVVLLFNDSIGGIIFGILLGNVCYWILDSIRRRGVRQFLKSLTVSLGATIVVGLFLLIVNVTGLFGYENYVPGADQVKSVTVRWSGGTQSGALGNFLSNNYPLKDGESIQRVIAFHEGIIQNKKELDEWNYFDYTVQDKAMMESFTLSGEYEPYAFENEYGFSDFSYGSTPVSLCYEMKNGMEVSRYYNVSILLTKPLYDIARNDAYVETYLAELEKVLLDSKLNKSIYFSSEEHYNYYVSSSLVSALFEAIKEDFKNRPSGFHLQSKINRVESLLINTYSEDSKYDGYWELHITPADTNILAILQKAEASGKELIAESRDESVSDGIDYYDPKADATWEQSASVALLPLSNIPEFMYNIPENAMCFYRSGSYCESVSTKEIPYKQAEEILTLCYTNWFGETAMDAIVIDNISYVIPPENLNKVKAILGEN